MSGNIYIPKPCHENWNTMTMEEKGRHCAVCSKVVKDFTGMQKKEIIDELKDTTGEVCGRISAQQVTPTKKQEKNTVLITGWLYRKAIYPVMALLGISLVTKKAMAQIDQPIMGKIAYNDYHTNTKKITVVVKAPIGNTILPNTSITVVGGVRHTPHSFVTDEKGRTTIELQPKNLTGDEIEIEVNAIGYQTKVVTIKLIKDIQTVEVRMENEIMIMGEMMYIPDEDRPIENIVIQPDTTTKIQIEKCTTVEVVQLPLIKQEDVEILSMPPVDIESIENNDLMNDNNNQILNIQDHSTQILFNVYPVPANDVVNISTSSTENFNLDVFDENGKRILSVNNSNERYQMNVADYAGGMYYLLIYVNGKAVETKKIIVTH